MTTKRKTPIVRPLTRELVKLLESMSARERKEAIWFLRFLKDRKKKKPEHVFVNPVETVLMAASQAEAMRHETYSIELLHKIAEHNQTALVPALNGLMQWALDLQREVNQVDAKLALQLEAKRAKGGKRVPKSR